jgi:hypothetical protein
VVVVLRIKSGHSVRYYTDATTEARENYYTGEAAAGEPPGRWSGAGAERLGLRGLVDPQVMIGVYERFLDPRDTRFGDESQWDDVAVLGHAGREYLSETAIYQNLLAAEPTADATRRDALRVEAGQKARKNVSFHDATFSMPKSVSVAHAAFARQEVIARRTGDLAGAEAWGTLRRAVEEAMWAGNNAAMDYLSEHAGYSRIGHHGGHGGQWIDAHDWTIASFFQHDSRDGDPHLHIHNVIHNRVECPDGVWRTFDSKAVLAFKGAAAAVGERTAKAHLYATLGVLAEMRPDGKARELVGVAQQVCALLSSRHRAIAPRAAELIAAFEARQGRTPSPLERDRLAHQAMVTTRRSKTRHETIEQRLDRVEAQIADELGSGLGQVAHDVLALAGAERAEAARWSPREVIETALAAAQSRQAAFSRSELTREISDTLPANLGITDGAQIAALLDYLTDRALELATPLDVAKPGDVALADQFRLADGKSAFVAPGRARYATTEHVQVERMLIEAARVRDGRAATRAGAHQFVDRLAESGIELGADQREALIGVLTSGARVASLVGPAGTGKSFVLGMLGRAWSDPATWADQPAVTQGRVLGLATSERAAGVLRAEGLAAANTTAWLAAQTRIAEHRALDTDTQWAIRPGDLVVIDESSMSDTAAVAAVHARIEAVGASMLLVGDHRQAGAVGAGGLGKLLAEHGRAYELTEARRFTEPWERTASLRLRAGDTSCLGDYHREGRILDGGTREQAEAAAQRGWLADHLAGRRSALVVDTNEQAGRLNASVRAELLAPRPRRRARRVARVGGHDSRGRGHRAGPPRGLGPRWLRRQPARCDQPRALPRRGDPRERRCGRGLSRRPPHRGGRPGIGDPDHRPADVARLLRRGGLVTGLRRHRPRLPRADRGHRPHGNHSGHGRAPGLPRADPGPPRQPRLCGHPRRSRRCHPRRGCGHGDPGPARGAGDNPGDRPHRRLGHRARGRIGRRGCVRSDRRGAARRGRGGGRRRAHHDVARRADRHRRTHVRPAPPPGRRGRHRETRPAAAAAGAGRARPARRPGRCRAR